jgi:hypothetical protein
MRWWRRLHDLRWSARLPIKAALLGITVVLVMFPYPNLLVRDVRRWRNPNALIDPQAKQLRPMLDELHKQLGPSPSPAAVLKAVERLVYQKVAYAWDWDVWGVADYLPTVQETLERGREDCDGQAIVAASLLRNLGYHAEIVSDFAHVWVKTNVGEIMHPGKARSVEATATGLRVHWRTLMNLPRALAFSVAVFPLARELIIAAVFWALLLRPGMPKKVSVCGGALLMAGLLVLRHGGQNWTKPVPWMQWLGLLLWIGTVVMLYLEARRIARRTRSASGEPAGTQ